MNELDEFEYVPVPKCYVLPIYGAIAKWESDLASDEDAPPRVQASDDEPTWSVGDLRRFASNAGQTNTTIGKVMDALAEEPGEYLSTTKVEQETGIPRKNLKGAFSALTRHINKHYDGRGWMLNFKWGPEIGSQFPAEGHYMLTEEQAKQWREARKPE